MIGKILGALIGAEVEKHRQQSGVKGAVIGAVVVGVVRRLGPIGLVAGGLYAAKKMLDRSRTDKDAA